MPNLICPVCGGELPEATDPDTIERKSIPATRRPDEPCICNEEIRIPGDSPKADPPDSDN